MQAAPPPVPGPFPVLVPKQARKRARPKEWLHRVALALVGMGNYTTWRLLHSAWGADEQAAAGVVYENWMDAWVTNGQKLNVVTPESILTPDVRLSLGMHVCHELMRLHFIRRTPHYPEVCARAAAVQAAGGYTDTLGLPEKLRTVSPLAYSQMQLYQALMAVSAALPNMDFLGTRGPTILKQLQGWLDLMMTRLGYMCSQSMTGAILNMPHLRMALPAEGPGEWVPNRTFLYWASIYVFWVVARVRVWQRIFERAAVPHPIEPVAMALAVKQLHGLLEHEGDITVDESAISAYNGSRYRFLVAPDYEWWTWHQPLDKPMELMNVIAFVRPEVQAEWERLRGASMLRLAVGGCMGLGRRNVFEPIVLGLVDSFMRSHHNGYQWGHVYTVGWNGLWATQRMEKLSRYRQPLLVQAANHYGCWWRGQLWRTANLLEALVMWCVCMRPDDRLLGSQEIPADFYPPAMRGLRYVLHGGPPPDLGDDGGEEEEVVCKPMVDHQSCVVPL